MHKRADNFGIPSIRLLFTTNNNASFKKGFLECVDELIPSTTARSSLTHTNLHHDAETLIYATENGGHACTLTLHQTKSLGQTLYHKRMRTRHQALTESEASASPSAAIPRLVCSRARKQHSLLLGRYPIAGQPAAHLAFSESCLLEWWRLDTVLYPS